MIRTAASLALLLASLGLAAQNGPGSNANSVSTPIHSLPGGVLIIYPATVRDCPIDIHAQQGVWDRNIRISEGDQDRLPQKFGQRISLHLKDSHPSRIVSATVRVRGLNGKDRTLPTPADSTQRANASRILKANFTEENDGSVSADLWIGGFTSVTSIELVDVYYSDGSAWAITGSGGCRVQPDPVMLITER